MTTRMKLGGLLLLGGALFAAVLGALPASADHGGLHCPDLPVNINPSHPDWHEDLDGDDDGIGCDDPDQPMWEEPSTTTTTAAPTSTTTASPRPTMPTPGPVPGSPDFTG